MSHLKKIKKTLNKQTFFRRNLNRQTWFLKLDQIGPSEPIKLNVNRPSHQPFIFENCKNFDHFERIAKIETKWVGEGGGGVGVKPKTLTIRTEMWNGKHKLYLSRVILTYQKSTRKKSRKQQSTNKDRRYRHTIESREIW